MRFDCEKRGCTSAERTETAHAIWAAARSAPLAGALASVASAGAASDGKKRIPISEAVDMFQKLMALKRQQASFRLVFYFLLANL